jgi:hypothetical protein
MKRKFVVSLLNTSTHTLAYCGGYLSSRVCACICEGVSVSTSDFEMLLCGNVDFRSANVVKVLIVVYLLHASAHGRLFSGRCWCNPVCVGVGVSVGLGVRVKIGDSSP